MTNNGVNPTTGTELDVFVPAGLEFLGCAGTPDHTTDAPTNPGSTEEWPGSGPIVVQPVENCVQPQSVETEELDPDGPSGPLAFGVYTHVVWPVGDLTSGQTEVFRYRAAVPIRANTNSFTGTRPSDVSGGQASNLDNNGGPEVIDETLLRTYAVGTGTYQGKTPFTASDDEILDRTAEDWVVHKSASSGTLAQRSITTWTLLFETSEYKFVEGATVEDTLPDGLCPLGPENFTPGNDPADEECKPVVGQEPSAEYASATENADGSWTLKWDEGSLPKLGHTGISDKFQITFPTRTRTHYQENGLPAGPILTRDRIENRVDTEGSGFARCTAPGTPDCSTPGPKIAFEGTDGATIVDASHAEQEAGAPEILKEVAESGPNCQTASYTTEVPHYHPGDSVCWRLRVNFPGTLDTSPQALSDFLPEGAAYLAGSDEGGPANNVSATINDSGAGEGLLTWTVTGSVVPAGGEIFEHFITSIAEPTGIVQTGDLTGNLFKFSSENTEKETFPQRAEVEYVLDAPEVDLVKGVEKIVRGGSTVGPVNGPNVDHKAVEANDEVTYRVDVTNDGLQAAANVEVWDQLPAAYDCAAIGEISDGGSCVDATPNDHIVWTLPSLAASGGTHKLTYTANVPSDIGPGRTLTNTAGVRHFQGETNTGGFFDYTPTNNIDPDEKEEPNAPAADDPSDVFTAGAAVLKAQETQVEEAGNNRASQATIGERIKYTLTAEVPEGTTLGGAAQLTDALSSTTRMSFVAGTASATLNGGPLPAGFALDTSGTTPKVVFPAGYANAPGTGVDKVVLSFEAVVTNVAANTRTSSALENQGALEWADPEAGAQKVNSNKVSAQVVEPLITQAKTDDANPNRVAPGDFVTFTVTTTNSNATRVSTAHEVEIVDLVPAGLIPVGAAPGNAPLADGAEIPGSGGATWHSGTRTITKKVATLAPNASTAFSYRTEVEKPAVAGASLTNEVKSTTASLAEGVEGRRTTGTGYEASRTDTIRIGGASIVKSSTPNKGTPGDPLTYTLEVTIPPSVDLYDTTVEDVLPAGVDFDGYVAETCVSGCPLKNSINRYKAVVNGATGQETIAWDLGDIPALSEPQVIKFTYNAHIRATNNVIGGKVVAGNTEVNEATVSSDLENKHGPFDEDELPTSFDETSPKAKTTTTVVEPNLTLDKQIKVGLAGSFSDGPVTAHGNDLLSYRLIVTNSGTSPAYNAEITDALDPALTSPVVSAQPGLNVITPWSEATHSMTLEIEGPIPAGGSATIEYTAGLIPQSGLHDGEQVVNTASLPKYFGVPEEERDANPSWEFRQYSDGNDSTEAVLDFPTFSVVKTTGLSGNPDSGNAEVNQEFPWRIVASNTSTTAGATEVVVTDTLPPSWSYVPGTAKFDGGEAPNPTVTPDAGGDKLEWTLPSLAAGASKTITFGAKPALGAKANPSNVNTAEVTGATDEGGKTEVGGDPYGSTPDNAEATLILPDLELRKTPDSGTAVAGQAAPFDFTIEVENKGDAVARNLNLEDLLPKGLSYSPGTATANPATGFSEGTVTADPSTGETTIPWQLDAVAAHATVTITVPVAVAADIPDGETLVNTVSVTSDEEPTPESDTGSVTVDTKADLTIAKTGDATYTAGKEYTWHLQVKNLGPSDAQNVEVKDPLPAGVTFVSASEPCGLSGGEVKCVLGTAKVGFDKSYDVTVAVEPKTITSPLANTATVSSTTEEVDTSNNTSTFGPSADPRADVWIKKSAEPGLILKTQETEYTLEVGNDGPSTARAVKLSDPMPGELAPGDALEFVSADDPPCSEASETVTCEFGDLEPGETRTVHVKAKGIKDGTWPNTATVSTTTPEPETPEAEENNHATSEVIVGPLVDMTINKTGPATVPAGGQITWTIDVSNDGPDDATGVTVEDTLPAGVVFVSADPGCSAAAGKVTCDLGDMAFGESAERHITVTVPIALADQTLTNTVTVEADQGELEKENNHSEAKTTVGPSADLAIVKTGPARVGADGDVTWSLTVTNNGPSTATGVKVVDTLPDGVELRSAQPSQGTCGGSVSCALGTLAKGGSAQIEVTAHVPASLGGQKLTNSAKVSGEEPDPDPSNNESSATTEVDPKPAPKTTTPPPTGFNLTLEKKLEGPSQPRLGDVLTYDLTVANQGPATANQVKITDELPDALEYVSASLPGGECGAKGAVVTCELDSLAAGAKKTATLKARAVGSGKIKNTASVSAAGADAKPADNRDAAVAAVAGVRTGGTVLQLTKKRLGPGLVEAGKKVKFRIKVRNSGRVAAEDVVVCDRLPGSMSFVKVRKAKFRHGDACWTIARLGAHRTRGFTVVARIDGGVGDTKLRNVAELEADNAPDRRATAPVRVESSGPGREGGVTG